MPLGFGNAVVLQTMYSKFMSGENDINLAYYLLLVALVSNLPEHHMAIGTGFVQLLRGLGM